MKSKETNQNKPRFPEFIILKASAGTGKTRALTLRFTQFLLSENIKHNHPRQMLAITFTRNAAKEMKERILNWLKACYFAPETDEVKQILPELPDSGEQLRQRAEKILTSLLNNFSDFQVMTIDSFMTDIFKASAVELGLSPEVEITIDAWPVISYAHSRLLRNLKPGTPEDEYFNEILINLEEWRGSTEAFIWDPAEKLQDFFFKLNKKLAGSNRQPLLYPLSRARQEIQELEEKFKKQLQKLNEMINACPAPRQRSALWNKLARDRLRDWLDYDFRTLPFKNTPLEIQQELEGLKEIINKYKELHARYFYQPHLQIYQKFLQLLNQIKKEQNLVFLEDIHCYLANYLESGVVPDIYLSLGGRIYHYLIDEFQDTSPLQWQNLYPLIENALSQEGSLFLVGDTKQAIYGFREADYQIMVNLINGTEGFPSVKPEVRELSQNRRSQPEILEWVKKIFPLGIKQLPKRCQKWREAGEWKKAASKSGLDDYECHAVFPADEEQKGYVEFKFLKLDQKKQNEENQDSDNNFPEENETAVEEPGKKELQTLIEDLKNRGYHYRDLAILAYENEKVKEVASWLNEKGIPFVPYSTLDIRNRQIIREILAFLQFLDYPLDNLNFSVFILGQLFQTRLRQEGFETDLKTFQEFILESTQTQKVPLYRSFRERFTQLWDRYFESFFKTTGYLPLYDLVCQIYRVFSPFELFPQEEGSLIKLLEVILNFEGQGKSNLRDFIKFSSEATDDKNIWTINVPENIEAVKIMTIHQAKGLGFPVVILLLYPEQSKSEEFYLKKLSLANDRRQPGLQPVEVLKLSAKTASANHELAELYQDYRQKEMVNKLNTLYVALTRAEKELYVIGLKKRKVYPFNLLEAIFGQEAPFNLSSSNTKPKVKIRPKHEAPRFPIRILPTIQAEEILPSSTINYEERHRGELIHAILAEIEYLQEDLEAQLEQIAEKLVKRRRTEKTDLKAAMKTIKAFLLQPEVAEYFQPRPDRRIAREMELVNRQGHLFRADRVIIDQSKITVIEFKTGQTEKEEVKLAHLAQLRNYICILQDIFPQHAVSGLLLYFDTGQLEIIP
ncbi:MAG: UvrD-helicase domain-containing protein [Candidatus Aminicenantes bacterium]|nr:UvrD-helicase domain-containing protein [Candidatus Aminicenantes bacterium]